MKRLSHSEMAWELSRQITSKQTWLRKFSRGKYRRPEWEVQAKIEQMEVLKQARDDYRRAAAKRSAA